MNQRLPIFQLTWGVNNGVFGLVFPSELEYETQYFTFVILIPSGYLHGRPKYNLFNQVLKETEYYFPVEVSGKYQEIPGGSIYN